MKWLLRIILIIFIGVFVYVGWIGYLGWQMYQSAIAISNAFETKNVQNFIVTSNNLNAQWHYTKFFLMPATKIPVLNQHYIFVNSAVETVVQVGLLVESIQKLNPITNYVAASDFDSLKTQWHKLISQIDELNQLIRNQPSWVQEKLPATFTQFPVIYAKHETDLKAMTEIVDNLPLLLGSLKPMHYIVLFQNNMELRPTGGFMGSYADVWLNQGKLQEFHIQDIYVPDGQIKGYVKEPLPIKKYLFNNNHPGWRLRDANWHPDFTESTKAINWFFQEGKLKPADGYIAINLFPIVDMLQNSHGVYLPDYNLTVTSENFYQEAQRHAEENFFPGSTQKGDFLRKIGNALLLNILNNPTQIQQIIPILYKGLQQKQIFVSVPDSVMPQWYSYGWNGSLHKVDNQDFLMVNEANMGSTKSNCCIDRSLNDQITATPSGILHHLVLHYQNNNPPKPEPPKKWGGGYKNYIRIITPQKSKFARVTINGKPVSATDIFTEAFDSGHMATGFLVLIEGGQESTVVIDYFVPMVEPQNKYSLFFQKQSGIEKWPLQLEIKNSPSTSSGQEKLKIQKNLDTDEVFEVNL